MNKYYLFIPGCIVFLSMLISNNSYSQSEGTIPVRQKVTLPQAHVGNLDIDTRLLDSYGDVDQATKAFYLEARSFFSENSDANFTSPEIIQAANKHNLPLMGGPMLSQLSDNGVSLWLRPSTGEKIMVKVVKTDGSDEKVYKKKSVKPGVEQRIVLDRLSPDTEYRYAVYIKKRNVAKGKFTTAPLTKDKGVFRITFGSCFHKIGLHNPNLINQIVKRKPRAMMLLGDIAVDDRENQISMHRSDYLLRDVSPAWRNLAANVPLYTSWDDHDYLNNDLSGIPDRFTKSDLEALRAVWQQNWNNPENEREGIYFNTRIGPAEIIMLDTRSCRTIRDRGQRDSYLGKEQLTWLKETLKKSDAPFKVISSGTMWSDYVTNGKDSWGTWDTEVRKEIFKFIETENIQGVLLISGDRHGARGFTIPRSSGFVFHEFEAASLGGVPGPKGIVGNGKNQLFGYHGTDAIAFGEFTFNTKGDQPLVVFRLIDQFGKILEEHSLPYKTLKP